MRRVARSMVRVVLRSYQLTFSFILGRRCRFYPSCSEYARQAIAQHGVRRGLTIGLWRVCRCGPALTWNGRPTDAPHSSGFDPVPPVWHNALPTWLTRHFIREEQT
jgi:uncharacterized protein